MDVQLFNMRERWFYETVMQKHIMQMLFDVRVRKWHFYLHQDSYFFTHFCWSVHLSVGKEQIYTKLGWKMDLGPE